MPGAPSEHSTPEALFADLVYAQPARPFVTCYDEATGERTELSVRSLANWVAKTHFLLTDELGLGPGDRAFIALPAHWISVPAVLGSLSAGLALSTTANGAAVAFVDPAAVPRAAGVADVFAVAPDSAAVGFGGSVPAGAQDYVAAVRPQADAWASVHSPATGADPGIDERSRAGVVAEARRRADELGMSAGARVLSSRAWAGAADWLDTLLAPLAVGGSVVYLRNNPDTATVARRYQQERCTTLLTG